MNSMNTKKSINSRRGSSGSTDSLTWWKFLFLGSLILLVCFLIRLNFQLVKEISRPATTGGAAPGAESAAADSPGMDPEAEERLKSLRSQVSSMKEKLGEMKSVANELQRSQKSGATPE